VEAGAVKTDHELLELAAKAAGFTYRWVTDGSSQRLRVCYSGKPADGSRFDSMDWNPLTDDGDALRLAVKLNLLGWHSDELSIGAAGFHSDPYAATRRAITRAVAAIGEGMAPFPTADQIREDWA
jgi:hypothetical protein